MVGAVRRIFGLGLVAMSTGLGACSQLPLYGNATPYRPSATAERSVADGSGVIVQRGETVHAIARARGISPRELIEANNLQPPYHLTAGQRLVIPSARLYQVQRGDTLYAIARRFGVDSASLARANNLQPPYGVQVGQRLSIPASERKQSIMAATQPAASAESPAVAETAPAAPAQTATAPAAASDSEPPAQTAAQTAAVSSPPAQPVGPPPARSGRGFLWPVHGKVISEYGPTGKGQHNDGLNLEAPRGTPVMAADDGVVAYAGNELRGFGNLLLIKHADGFVTAYAHCDELLVKRGDKVKRGQAVGRVGQTGNVTAPQLHFEVRRGTQALDPRAFLPELQAKL